MSGRPLPAAIGRYEVRGILGAGGMGTVFRAHDPVIDRPVAIKVVRTESLDEGSRAEYLARFRLEAQSAARCAHPGIVTVYDFASGDADPYIIMELVEGRSLQQLLRDPEGRAALPVVAILLQVLAALGFAHRLGITHRDIKPANIIVTADDVAKIADFGIARVPEGSSTQAGDMLGTPSYMAPEQIAGADVDHRADLFAVGAILYEVLAGRPPFAGRSTAETLLHLSGPGAAAMAPVAGQFGHLLRRALSKQRTARFQSADAFAAALRDAGDADGNATLVMRPAAFPAAAPAIPSLAGAADFDATTLARMERALAPYVGPMARVMVMQAVRETTTVGALADVLARGLQGTADRAAFLHAIGGTRMEPTSGLAVETPRPEAAPPVARDTGIPPDAVAAAQAVLAVFIGPMARVLARKAAEQATSSQDFIERLCEYVPKADEGVTLRRRLRADVEPKLR